MCCEYKNIYQIARKSANQTREQAVEGLHVSVRSLADYESGKTIPPEDIVCRMVEIYNTPWLAYQHFKTSSELGKFLPGINFSDVAKSVLRFQKEIGDVEAIKPKMIEIACDGMVETQEADSWGNVKKEIKDVIGAGFSVLFAEGVCI